MWEALAKILCRHTASTIGSVTGRKPDRIHLARLPQGEERPVCGMAVSIDFDGVLAEARRKPVVGYMACGVACGVDVQPLLKAMVIHLGLDPAILETEAGPQNILNELLNIIIGLTGADWAERGFEMNFSPPHVLSGQALPPPVQGDQAFHVHVFAPDNIQLDIVVVFNYLNRPGVSREP